MSDTEATSSLTSLSEREVLCLYECFQTISNDSLVGIFWGHDQHLKKEKKNRIKPKRKYQSTRQSSKSMSDFM